MRLLLLLNNSRGESTDYHIAEVMLRHFSELTDMQQKQLAELCFVSASTLSKFIRHLGYEDFAEFKTAAAYRGDHDTNALNYNDNVLGYLQQHSPQEYISLLVSELERARAELDMTVVDEIVQDLCHYPVAAAFGVMYSETAALDFQMKLAVNQKYILTYMDIGKQYEFIRQAGEDTLLIIFSNSGNYIKKYEYMQPYIEKNIFHQTKAKVVLITCNPEMKNDKTVDTCLCLPHSGTLQVAQIMFQLATDLLASGYCKQRA